ncbi:MAG TPA: GDSL-type esterase/lipase family protein [Melioribacteraceae bacterium]|nr:GDSL-type esterase/lipase family protein [Melioribacteraceae bacterium]
MNKKIYIFCLVMISFTLNAQNDTTLYLKNPNYQQELSLYEAYKTKQADIIMFGNSITHGANWNELLDRKNVVERGISSDGLDGYIARLPYIISLKPKFVFIMGGINDIYNWTPVEKIFEKYVRLISELKKNNIKPVIQSTLFAGNKWKSYSDRNKEVIRLNKMLSDYAKKNLIEFVDLNKKLSAKNILIAEYTYDGLHLNGKGYAIWAIEVDKILKKYSF